MKMLFAVNVDTWNPSVLSVFPTVPKSKELHFIGLYNDADGAIEYIVAHWILNSMQTRDLVFRPTISSDSVREENVNAVEAWTMYVNGVSYAFFTTKNAVNLGTSMGLAYDHGQFRPGTNVELIKWDLDMIHRLIKFIDRDVDRIMKERDRNDELD